MNGNHGNLWSFPAILLMAVLLSTSITHAQEGAAEETHIVLEKFARDYQIQMVTADAHFPVKTMHGMIDGKNADVKELQAYVKIFAEEFAIYPADLVQRAKLKRVVFCNDLSFAGQRRSAIPDFEHDTLYLDVSRGQEKKFYQRKVIHHEFFHIIDQQDDGDIYRDDRWASLNPEKFQYGDGGRNAQDRKGTANLTGEYPGFLNHYSTMGVEEDKAEVFANLIVEPDYIEDKSREDSVLKVKVIRMKELLASFCPEMNDKFWARVQNMSRTEK